MASGGFDARFGALIGSVYDAVIDPSHWPEAIDGIRRAFSFEIAMIGISKLPGGEPLVQVSCNVPDAFVRSIGEYGEEILELWGGTEGAGRVPLEEPLLQTDYSSPAQWQHNRFYTEWARPQGLINQLAVFLARDRLALGSLGLGRHGSVGPITKAEVAGVGVIAPHLARAVTISRLLDLSSGIAATFDAALDAAAAGVVLVDAQMGILHANAAARDMLRAGDPVRENTGRLELSEEIVPGHLGLAVEMAAGHEAELGRRGVGIPARRRDGTPAVIHVMPLEQRAGRPGAAWRSVAAVFITDPASPPNLPLQAMTVLFGLTPAEAKVFELILAGQSSAQIAKALAIAPSTVRTHVLRLFAKTGRHSRGDLGKLAREMAPPL
jgi:DNA-binding CsgD family transcriptional regulator/PAS domain-containing protein